MNEYSEQTASKAQSYAAYATTSTDIGLGLKIGSLAGALKIGFV